MRAKSLRFLVAAPALLSLFLLPAAFGPTAQFQLVADVPFDFHVNGKLLPAGTYRVSSMQSAAVLVSAMEPSGPRAAALTHAAGGGTVKHETSQLVFHRYGDSYFLRQVWRAGMEVGCNLPASRPEKEVLFRAANAQPDRVYVAARDAR
jgi:hypothetical protein